MKIVETEQELRACYPVMKELRPHLQSEDAFVAQVLRQYEQNYRILAVLEGDAVVALAGYRCQENTVYGRFLYVDDLVTAEQHRSHRWGALLLGKLTVFAQEARCARLVLDTAFTNVQAQRFYFREGLLPGSMRFGKVLA
ncbi:Acetyltransferase (GNAT) family protein [Duganella sacchari]|uniref:Acetyltransferase (GNAT) family protein n=1 Tax=Duganella sacchari TaxID=551987 RepID=A0A1M7M441_9BURK|nr:GNAT family N-acetyltransferase [Duganella sacchari]SHM85353.1 Acetyltransferase (GNAT) family protein [Duganella sacchari]